MQSLPISIYTIFFYLISPQPPTLLGQNLCLSKGIFGFRVLPGFRELQPSSPCRDMRHWFQVAEVLRLQNTIFTKEVLKGEKVDNKMNMTLNSLVFTTNNSQNTGNHQADVRVHFFSKWICYCLNHSFQMARHLWPWKHGPSEVITWIACKYIQMPAVHHLQLRPVNNPSFPPKSKWLYCTQAIFTEGSRNTLIKGLWVLPPSWLFLE